MLRHFGLREGAFVGVCRKENDRDVRFLSDGFSGFDPVHLALEHDVHEDDVRHVFQRKVHGHFAGVRSTHHIVPQFLEAVLDVLAYDAFVLNNEDIGLRHDLLVTLKSK